MSRSPLIGVLGLLAAAAACGSHREPGSGDDALPLEDASTEAPADASPGGGPDAVDASPPLDAAPTPDAFPAVLDVRIDCHNTCVLTATPARIDVPAGTAFEVNWINVGDTECDVAKIDSFNHVPIILGLEPGTSYHDTVREWCGALFTGTFDFRVSICTLPSYIPVDCSAN
ncbi:MAG: hypothetical protein JWP01_1927 [Myxococcales bacterium]|nr:hypothetical protein [Myxococcales bacterium]